MTNSARGSTSSRDPSMRVEQSSEQILPSKGRKLTGAQRELLTDANDGGYAYCGYSKSVNATAWQLDRMGFGSVGENNCGPIIRITDAGRAALGDGGGMK